MRHRTVTDSTPRRIDNATQRNIIVEVLNNAQVGDNIAYFLTLIKPGATNHRVRHAHTNEDIL